MTINQKNSFLSHHSFTHPIYLAMTPLWCLRKQFATEKKLLNFNVHPAMKPTGTEINLLFLTTASKMQMSFPLIHSSTWPAYENIGQTLTFMGWSFRTRVHVNHGGWKGRKNEVKCRREGDDRWRWICIRRAKGESPDSFTKTCRVYVQTHFAVLPQRLNFLSVNHQPNVSSQFLFVCCLRLSFFMCFFCCFRFSAFPYKSLQ